MKDYKLTDEREYDHRNNYLSEFPPLLVSIFLGGGVTTIKHHDRVDFVVEEEFYTFYYVVYILCSGLAWVRIRI